MPESRPCGSTTHEGCRWRPQLGPWPSHLHTLRPRRTHQGLSAAERGGPAVHPAAPQPGSARGHLHPRGNRPPLLVSASWPAAKPISWVLPPTRPCSP
eukprot:scaffold211_cov447-Prasinococcus_capsulatus_cf.AAC.9